MSELELTLLFLVACTAGGAWGARSGDQPAWKGMLLVLASTLLTAIIAMVIGSTNMLIGIVTNIMLAAIIGGAMKMTPTQIGKVIMASILVAIPVGLILGIGGFQA